MNNDILMKDQDLKNSQCSKVRFKCATVQSNELQDSSINIRLREHLEIKELMRLDVKCEIFQDENPHSYLIGEQRTLCILAILII